MNTISFNTFIQNTKTPNVRVANSPEIKELKEDTVELSSKKSEEKPKKNIKKWILIGAGIGLAIGACVAIVKARNLTKAKQEITKLYDDIFEEMQKTSPEQLNFEKPELVFKRLRDNLGGGYIPATNQIHIDPRDLRRSCILKDLSKVTTTNIAEGLDVADEFGRDNVLNILKKGLSDKYRIATKNEALALSGSVLSHELQHARQFQMLLSTEGGLEQYIQSLKAENPTFTDEVIKKTHPFLFGYKPKMLFNPDKVAIIDDVAGEHKIKYGIKAIIEAFTKYTSPSEDKFKYYTNLAEISARAKEASYWKKLEDGTLPRPKGVSDEYIKHFKGITSYNAVKLAEVIAHSA